MRAANPSLNRTAPLCGAARLGPKTLVVRYSLNESQRARSRLRARGPYPGMLSVVVTVD